MVNALKPIFIDTNIFLYSVGADHPLKQSTLTILKAVEADQFQAFTSSEVLQELVHYLRPRINFQQAIRLFLQLPIIILPVGEIEVRKAFDIITKLGSESKSFKSVETRDFIHVATMESAGLSTIVSADSHFDHFKHITRIDPVKFAQKLSHNAL